MTSPSPMADAPKPLTLEPCPFCGAKLQPVEGRPGIGVHPHDETAYCMFDRKLILDGEAWNRRAEVTASRAARGETNEAMAKRLGALFVLALQSGDAETREAARVASGELDWAYGYPRFLPALAASPAPAEVDALTLEEIERLRADNEVARSIFRLFECIDFERFTEHDELLLEDVKDMIRAAAATPPTKTEGDKP